jgi:tripartite-type tricarboxylate transporter receptor subunit TctC
LLAALLIGFGTTAHAQEKYPTRPIKLIVAVLPGGPMDVMGRLIAQHLSSTFGQVFVENRAGAGTTLGAKAVASAEPDGYTLLLGNAATLAIGPTLYKSAGYDPITSFAPVAFLASVPYVLIVSPSLRQGASRQAELRGAERRPTPHAGGLVQGAHRHRRRDRTL